MPIIMPRSSEQRICLSRLISPSIEAHDQGGALYSCGPVLVLVRSIPYSAVHTANTRDDSSTIRPSYGRQVLSAFVLLPLEMATSLSD